MSNRDMIGNRHNPDSLEALYEAQADELIKRANGARGEYPAYPEGYLKAKERRRGEVSIEEVWDESNIKFRAIEDLFACMWVEIRSGASFANLSERQITFLELRRWQCPVREIAEITGWSKSTVARDLVSAATSIQRIPAFGLWSVLAEVFRVDVSRIRDFILNN